MHRKQAFGRRGKNNEETLAPCRILRIGKPAACDAKAVSATDGGKAQGPHHAKADRVRFLPSIKLHCRNGIIPQARNFSLRKDHSIFVV
jgi:hypothetical protein